MTLFDNLPFEVPIMKNCHTDQILQAQISDGSGFLESVDNVGESQNQGVEMFAAISPVTTNSFNWNFSANASYNQSKVLSLGD